MISIIIPTYNRERVFFDSLSSVFFQNFSNIEIVIIDDGSIDNTFLKFLRFIENPFYYFKILNFPYKERFENFINTINHYSCKEIKTFNINQTIKNTVNLNKYNNHINYHNNHNNRFNKNNYKLNNNPNIKTLEFNTFNKNQYIEILIFNDKIEFIKKYKTIFKFNFNTIDNKISFSRTVLYIKIKENSGTAFAKNIGIYFSTSEYIGFLDSDDLFIQGKISKILNFLKKNKIYVCQSFDIYFKEGKRISLPENRKKTEGNIFTKQLQKNRISISSLIINRKVLNKFKTFTPNEFFPTRFKVLEDYFFYLNLTFHFKIHLIKEELTVIRQSKQYNNLSHQFKNYEQIRLKSLYNFSLLYINQLTNRKDKQLFKEILNHMLVKYLILIKGKVKRKKFLDILTIQNQILNLIKFYSLK